jgi:hypothetical protein
MIWLLILTHYFSVIGVIAGTIDNLNYILNAVGKYLCCCRSTKIDSSVSAKDSIFSSPCRSLFIRDYVPIPCNFGNIEQCLLQWL